MTATVFLILLICLLTMRFFTTCMIVLLIGVFVLADQPAHAKSACDPAFVTMNAILVQATMTCNKNYMDTKIGIDAAELAHQCDAVLGKQKIHSIMKTAIRGFESDIKDRGEKEACALVDNAFSEIGEAVKN